ncbi:MAG: hypothetical protein ABSE77_19465 [Acidimicrobiales bacterium]|jgi:hypothetical protein
MTWKDSGAPIAYIFSADKGPERAEMTGAEGSAVMELLASPDLGSRVGTDLASLGVAGETTNLVMAYLATVSRKAGDARCCPSGQPSGRCHCPETSGLAAPGHTRWSSLLSRREVFPQDMRLSRY